MLYLFTGTDRAKAHAAMRAALKKAAKGASVVHISDSNTLADLEAALAGGGMFAERRAIVLDSVLADETMREALLAALPSLKDSDDTFFMLEERPDAATRKKLEKYAESTERYDAVKKKERRDVFALASALKRGDRKAAWLHYQEELLAGAAPEALHGILFWGAKDLFLKARDTAGKRRAARLVEALAALPHEARRRGEELEYALERFLLALSA